MLEQPTQLAPPPRRGMSDGTKIVLILAITLVVLAVLCSCTVLGLTFIYNVSPT